MGTIPGLNIFSPIATKINPSRTTAVRIYQSDGSPNQFDDEDAGEGCELAEAFDGEGAAELVGPIETLPVLAPPWLVTTFPALVADGANVDGSAGRAGICDESCGCVLAGFGAVGDPQSK